MYKLMMLPLLGILTAGTAIAQPQPSQSRVEQRQEQREQRVEKLAARLGLDAPGKAKLEATFARYGAEMRPVRQDLRQTREALRAELAGSKDATRLSSLTAQLASDRDKLQALRAAKMSELQQELTPAQYAQLIVSRHEGRRGHHERHGGER